jgi:sensor c-di-GMP phosphodiesterase-like protein
VGIVLSDNERALIIFTNLPIWRSTRQKEGSQQIKVFRQWMLQRLQESRTLEHDMALAIDHNEFVVYYQPIVDSFSNEIYGYEALIRWIHPVKGILAPDYFISVAEKRG